VTIPLTRDMLRAAYDFLNETPPFNKWNLPDGEDVEFKIIRNRDRFGWYRFNGEKHVIALSSGCIGYTDTLLRTMAHEMIHLHEEHAEACTPRQDHSRAFYRWAAQICASHGWDAKAF
jgi:SprT-like family